MAILNVSSYITSAGLQSVTSAGALGPYFAVKYFVPFYDPRIDGKISLGHSANTSAMNISAMNLTSATSSTLYGEKIYASMADNYSLSPSNFFYQLPGMNTLVDGATGILQTKQEVLSNVNLLNNQPLSTCVSAASITPSATIGAYTLTNTKNLSGTNLSNYNPLSATPYPTSAFYRVQSYSPKALGTTSASGMFKCRIPASKGSFKFNGLALYTTKVDGNNNNSTNTSPSLFAVVLFDKPQEKSSNVGGMNSYEFDVELGFDWSIVGAGGSTPVYVDTSYWTKVPTASNTSAYALNYDGDVVISSSASPGSWMPQGKLTITDPSKTQLRLANNNSDTYGDRYTDFRTKRKFLDGATINEFDSKSSVDIGVLNIDTACSTDGLLELGTNNRATGLKSIAIGLSCSAVGYIDTNTGLQIPNNDTYPGGFNLSFGISNLSVGEHNTSFGISNKSQGVHNSARGIQNFAGLNYSAHSSSSLVEQGFNTSFGLGSSALSIINQTLNNSSYFSGDTNTRGGFNIAYGLQCLATLGNAISIGWVTSAIGTFSNSIGAFNLSNASFATTLGYKLSASGIFTSLIGASNYSDSQFTFVGGANNGVSANGASQGFNFVYGSKNILNGLTGGFGNFVFGDNNDTQNNNYSIVFGSLNKNNSTYGITFGASNSATSQYGSITIGYKNSNNGEWSVVGGSTNTNNADNSIVFGSNNIAEVSPRSFVIGDTSYSQGGLALGYNVSAYNNSVSIGNNNSSSFPNSLTFGNYTNSPFTSSIAIGNNITTTFDEQILIGNDKSNTSYSTSAITISADMFIVKSNSVEIPGYTTDRFSIHIKKGICGNASELCIAITSTRGRACNYLSFVEGKVYISHGSFTNTVIKVDGVPTNPSTINCNDIKEIWFDFEQLTFHIYNTYLNKTNYDKMCLILSVDPTSTKILNNPNFYFSNKINVYPNIFTKDINLETYNSKDNISTDVYLDLVNVDRRYAITNDPQITFLGSYDITMTYWKNYAIRSILRILYQSIDSNIFNYSYSECPGNWNDMEEFGLAIHNYSIVNGILKRNGSIDKSSYIINREAFGSGHNGGYEIKLPSTYQQAIYLTMPNHIGYLNDCLIWPL